MGKESALNEGLSTWLSTKTTWTAHTFTEVDIATTWAAQSVYRRGVQMFA